VGQPGPLRANSLVFLDLFANIDQMRRQRDYLGQFELMVLLAVIRIGDDAYGVPIARELEAATNREAGIGSVYAALERLQEKGLVSSSVGDPTPERGGRAKQYFHVTSKGLKAAREARRTLNRLWQPAMKGGSA
jgi:PadR family transcriptional regulator PadR